MTTSEWRNMIIGLMSLIAVLLSLYFIGNVII